MTNKFLIGLMFFVGGFLATIGFVMFFATPGYQLLTWTYLLLEVIGLMYIMIGEVLRE